MSWAITKEASTITCPHAGVGTVPSATTVLTAGGNNVIHKTEAQSIVIVGCTWMQTGQVPCTAVTSVTLESTTLTKGGVGVVVESTVILTNSNSPSNQLNLTANQSVLKG